MVHAESEQIVRRRRRSLRHVDGTTEEQPEPWTARAERGRRRERQIDLQAARQQKHSIDRGPSWKVEQVGCIELGHELPRPVGQDVAHRHVVGHSEGQVEIRPAIAAAIREPADDGGGDHVRIGRGHLEHAIMHAIPVLDAEHAVILRFVPRVRN